jgi:hypothetical protein
MAKKAPTAAERAHFTMATAQLKFVPKQAPRRAATGSRDA